MKAEEVLNLLQISRKTLHVYAHDGRIRYTVMPNKRYDYSEEDVYKILNKDVKRKTVLYARVSTSKQKNDLQNQIDQMKQWCFMNGYTINAIYSDIASGISFEKRKGFFEMLDEIMNSKVEKVVITYKDRLSRSGFELFSYLFRKYRTEIVVISEVGSTELDSEEVFEDMASMIHCYSMKMYSKRRNHSVEVGYEG
ncbi:MAG: IS607 family transposase [Candidatus Thermoplasmatota archaeon]|nr:IS607 family transposase [Candidatus Thermoplasmatota archaeon]